MTIKKNFQEIVEMLEANPNSKVKDLLPSIIEMCSTKVRNDTLRYDEDGNLTHIYCYYHKEWEAISEVEYGSKKGTKSGLNTMCKEGVRAWTKKQKEAKDARNQLLEDVANGSFKGDLQEELAKIEAERTSNS